MDYDSPNASRSHWNGIFGPKGENEGRSKSKERNILLGKVRVSEVVDEIRTAFRNGRFTAGDEAIFVVSGSSMFPLFRNGDRLFFVRLDDAGLLKGGEVVLYLRKGKFLAHRFLQRVVWKEGREILCLLRGDNPLQPAECVRTEDILGVCVMAQHSEGNVGGKFASRFLPGDSAGRTALPPFFMSVFVKVTVALLRFRCFRKDFRTEGRILIGNFRSVLMLFPFTLAVWLWFILNGYRNKCGYPMIEEVRGSSTVG